MTEFEWIVVLLSVMSVLLIPSLALIIHLITKWTRAESQLEDLGTDLKELIRDKDKVHSEMLTQMRLDRDATNLRLRWLEENVWKSGGKFGLPHSSQG